MSNLYSIYVFFLKDPLVDNYVLFVKNNPNYGIIHTNPSSQYTQTTNIPLIG